MEITGMKASVKFSREEDQPNPLARLKLPFIFNDLPFQSRFSASDLSDLRLELLTDFPNAPSFGLALRPLNHNSPLTLSFRSPSSFPISISAEFKPGSPFHHSPKISLSINHQFGDFSHKSSIKIPFKDNNNNNQARLEIEDQDDDDGDGEDVERRGFSIRKLILPSNAKISAGTTATSSVALFDGAGIKVHWGLSLPVVRDGRLWWSSLQAAEFPVSLKKITLEIKPKKRFENRLKFGEEKMKKTKDECEGKGINDILHVRQEKSLLPDSWPSLLKSLF